MSSQTPSVLARILHSTREELQRRKREVPERALQERLAQFASADAGHAAHSSKPPSRGLRQAIAQPGISVIAEFKRRSPSAGTLREAADLQEVVGAYERGGASALSVLTEGPNFGGSLDDLRAARELCQLPIDAFLDEHQSGPHKLTPRQSSVPAIIQPFGRDKFEPGTPSIEDIAIGPRKIG